MNLALVFFISFTAGLLGAVSPGPVLTYTVQETLKRGFWAGPLVVLGHGILELALVVGLYRGLGSFLHREAVVPVVGIAGGLVLVALGVATLLGSRRIPEHTTSPGHAFRRCGPIGAGILTSLSNPYWLIWWCVVGMVLIAMTAGRGFRGAASFFCGHISADLAWYSLVSLGVSRGKKFLGRSGTRAILVACGIFLVLFGVWFLTFGVLRFRAA